VTDDTLKRARQFISHFVVFVTSIAPVEGGAAITLEAMGLMTVST
jgi:hypothetical protein